MVGRRGLHVERLTAAQRTEECLLSQVLGNRTVMKQAPQEPVHRQPITVEKAGDEIAIHCPSVVIATETADPLIG
jgi:hypothetical protein